MHPKDDGKWDYKQWDNLLVLLLDCLYSVSMILWVHLEMVLGLQFTPEVYKISFKRATKTIFTLNNGDNFFSENSKIFHSLNLNFDMVQLGFDNWSKGRCLASTVQSKFILNS